MNCPNCGRATEDDARFCPGCGQPLEASAVYSTDNLRLRQFQAVIGADNQAYYLERFDRFEQAGRAGSSWHWPAFFVTFYWLLYRKLWVPALLYFLSPYFLAIAVAFVGTALGPDGATLAVLLWGGYMIAIFVLPALYANALYYRHCCKKIAQAQATSPDLGLQLGPMAGKGGTSKVFLIVVAFALIALVGILAAIAIPAYSDFTQRAKTAEAWSYGEQASRAVMEFHDSHHRFPETLAEAGFMASQPRNVKAVRLERGTITLDMERGSLSLVPSLDADQNLSWRCVPHDLARRQLPYNCRENSDPAAQK